MTYALFSSSDAARRAVEALRHLRVKDEAISVVDAAKLDHFHEGDGRGGAPSTDPTHASPVTGGLEGGRAPDSDQRKEANTAQVVAGGMAVAAVGTGILFPPIGIILGGGALAATLMGVLTKNSGAQESSHDLVNYLRAQNLSDDTVALIQSQLESGGSLMQIDTVAAELPEAQILQVVSDHGGRVAWDLGSGLSHAPTARHA